MDWSTIIAMLLPYLPQLMEALVKAIIKWLEDATPEQVAAMGQKIGIAIAEAQKAKA